MAGIDFLKEARSVGLSVERHGQNLRIRGPRQYEVLAKRLLDHKSEVLAALEMEVIAERPHTIQEWFKQVEEARRQPRWYRRKSAST